MTNMGVVGEDNAFHEWLKTTPQLHDVPGQDIIKRPELQLNESVDSDKLDIPQPLELL
jgi:hypothetical protein